MKKSYDEKKYQDISKILKKMPRVNAPDNFEYNLMTKIENENFGTLAEDKVNLGFAWKLTPALAFLTSIVILFFVWNDQNGELENPLMKMPRSISQTEIIPADHLTTGNDVVESSTQSKSFKKSTPNIATKSDDELFRVIVGSNDVISKEKVSLNLNAANTIDLDNYLHGDVQNPSTNNRSRLVGGGETFEFNGFYIKEQTDRKLLESIKNRVDSLRSVQNDSLGKRAILPE